jgi:hypothetical protein
MSPPEPELATQALPCTKERTTMAVPTPSTSSDEKKQGMYVKDSQFVVDAVDQAAAKSGRTRASYLRMIIRASLANKGFIPESERFATDDDDEGAN